MWHGWIRQRQGASWVKIDQDLYGSHRIDGKTMESMLHSLGAKVVSWRPRGCAECFSRLQLQHQLHQHGDGSASGVPLSSVSLLLICMLFVRAYWEADAKRCCILCVQHGSAPGLELNADRLPQSHCCMQWQVARLACRQGQSTGRWVSSQHMPRACRWLRRALRTCRRPVRPSSLCQPT
jgi:hypothetical protein